MNGVMPGMPGPLLLAIASATKNASLENKMLIQKPRNDTVTGKKADRNSESMNRRAKTGVDGDATAASRETSEMHRVPMLEGGTSEECEERHGVS